MFLISNIYILVRGGGGAVAQSVERSTPGEEIPGSIPAVAAPLPTGWVGVSIM